MSWQIRARNYDTSGSNFSLIVIALISLGGAYFGFYVGSLAEGTLLVSILMGAGIALLFILLFMSITHSTTIIVYRFTETLAEEYSWKPQEAAAASFLKWAAIILLPIVGVLILMDPSLVIAGIGPLGMGLMAGMMGAKKNENEHHPLDWRKTDKIYLYPGREIIGLNIPWYSPDLDKMMPRGVRQIYCKKGEREEVLNFFTTRLPEIDVVEEKFFL
ncbi:hypothetical protein [Halomonas sp. PA16-9]|uniref:hypothetical protein n=2 Tax=Halomonas TaxID=2745 RepID=UPI0030ED1F7B